jgi:FlaA1/EpsC-like NDP-sugar epimerase
MNNSRVLQTEFASNSEFFTKIVGRAELELVNSAKIKAFFAPSRVLIIGAGGTIGSAVARRLLTSGINDLYFLDRDESALHALALGLSHEAASHSDLCIVADVKDFDGLDEVFKKYKPDVVIHAAALKHLVIVERFPREGYITNVIGTRNILEAAKRNGVSQVVNISTDKAANPTSILGKTKRITELLVESYNHDSGMTCCSVRFGNVFASRGSVIETFIHQITNGLPVTLTHLDVTRFFMSHDEAANLILASAMNRDIGVFVQNMGEEILVSRIVEQLAMHLGQSYSTRIIGLQPGEKLNEELYGGAFETTSIPEIVKVNIPLHLDIASLVRAIGAPTDNRHANEIIEQLLENSGM